MWFTSSSSLLYSPTVPLCCQVMVVVLLLANRRRNRRTVVGINLLFTAQRVEWSTNRERTPRKRLVSLFFLLLLVNSCYLFDVTEERPSYSFVTQSPLIWLPCMWLRCIIKCIIVEYYPGCPLHYLRLILPFCLVFCLPFFVVRSYIAYIV